MRYVVNLLGRHSAYPYDKDEELTTKFQRVSLLNLETVLAELDALQLVFLLNASMESIRRPYCSKNVLIHALEWFSPLWHEEREEVKASKKAIKVSPEDKIPKENTNSEIMNASESGA